jgi:hypothetical protein
LIAIGVVINERHTATDRFQDRELVTFDARAVGEFDARGGRRVFKPILVA